MQPLNDALMPRSTSGFDGSRSVKCKCGPVELPLLPLSPTCSLAATIWPILVSMRRGRGAERISFFFFFIKTNTFFYHEQERFPLPPPKTPPPPRPEPLPKPRGRGQKPPPLPHFLSAPSLAHR